jgi:hypothetical protein
MRGGENTGDRGVGDGLSRRAPRTVAFAGSVGDAEIVVVVAPQSLPRPRIVPRILIGLRAAGRTTMPK